METRFIFITGGVASSLGKGIVSASLGKLLQARGYTITIQKFDPYINIDPGTLNPYEHGECYVTADGMETDLDLGHYERFAAEYCRTHDVPTFGICLGMQMMVVEFARNVLGYSDANSIEMEPRTLHPVIDLMEAQKAVTQLGGTMRLGAYECELREGSQVAEAYRLHAGDDSRSVIRERHRHRYEFNNRYQADFEAAGMKCVGMNPETRLVEIVELADRRWYVGTQFHPEYSSTVMRPHPLFMDFVKACVACSVPVE